LEFDFRMSKRSLKKVVIARAPRQVASDRIVVATAVAIAIIAAKRMNLAGG
jgi:hypothetical protein